MTETSETLKRPDPNKIQLSIRLTEASYKLLETELKNLKATEYGWNMSNLIDAIVYMQLSKKQKKC